MFNEHSHIVQSYDEELEDITDTVIDMGRQVIVAMEIAMCAIKQEGDDLLKKSIENDEYINALDSKLEQKALALLALRQPMAGDLRFIVTAIKIATILERVGDLAKNVACRMSLINFHVSKTSLELIEQMYHILLEMINNVLLAFSKRDANLAAAVWEKDPIIDSLYDKLFALLKHEIAAEPNKVDGVMQIIFAVKNYERIGDYMVKFAKHIYFVVNGMFPKSNVNK